MIKPHIYTVESVTSGHPDKVCDQISDAILDECLRQDPKSRVATETFGAHGLLVIGGEVTTNTIFNAEEIAQKVYRDIGYNEDLRIITNIIKQSPDIAQGVDTGGAGDQGIMYGYAAKNGSDELLPESIVLVHKLTKGLENLRRSGNHNWIGPDGKAQVTMEGNRVKTILVSTQHSEDISQDEIKKLLIENLITPLVGDISNIEILVNPTGKFVVGGFIADAGLTGRKIMVDTYCGLVPHGGGCFSGKDPTKVDRSAAYMARKIAVDYLKKYQAREVFTKLAYAIGKPNPVMAAAVVVYPGQQGGDGREEKITGYDLTPRGIRESLKLDEVKFADTASWGHFGRGFPWQ